MSAKYPYLTAYVGFVALSVVIGLVLNVVLGVLFGLFFTPGSTTGLDLIGFIIMMVISFFIFKFVIQKNVLPHVTQEDEEQPRVKIA